MVRGVSIPSSRPLRARNADEKKQRRSEILRAAETLWQSTPYNDLSMSQVAREARLAKGTLYLYFDTKEQLFLALLAEHLEIWLKDLLLHLQTHKFNDVDEFTDFMVSSVLPQDSLRRMLVLLHQVIDSRISEEQSQNFRRRLLRYVVSIVEVMPYDRQANLRILMHVYSLSVGWQMVASGPHLADHAVFLAESPNVYPRPEFENEFTLGLRAAIRAIVQEAQANYSS